MFPNPLVFPVDHCFTRSVSGAGESSQLMFKLEVQVRVWSSKRDRRGSSGTDTTAAAWPEFPCSEPPSPATATAIAMDDHVKQAQALSLSCEQAGLRIASASEEYRSHRFKEDKLGLPAALASDTSLKIVCNPAACPLRSIKSLQHLL